MTIVLASASQVRRALLERAGVPVTCQPARVDEASLAEALVSEGAAPRDVADALAEAKAVKVAARGGPGQWTIGCDQVLDFRGHILRKATTRDEAEAQLGALSGEMHRLFSAVVICEGTTPVWRQIGEARLTMRAFSAAYLAGYLDRNWPSVADSVGCYKLEEEGVRLFSRIDGDYFTILGLPLLEVLGYLTLRGAISG